MSAQAGDLGDALKAAQDKADTDAQTARDLAAKLKAAQARLAALQAQPVIAAPPTTTVTRVVQQTAAPAASPSGEHEDGGEGGYGGGGDD